MREAGDLRDGAGNLSRRSQGGSLLSHSKGQGETGNICSRVREVSDRDVGGGTIPRLVLAVCSTSVALDGMRRAADRSDCVPRRQPVGKGGRKTELQERPG